jgi:hypothetical protein
MDNKPLDTGMLTRDGLTIYDLQPLGGELTAVAGPGGHSAAAVAHSVFNEDMPDGFRWVDTDEWADCVESQEDNNYKKGTA